MKPLPWDQVGIAIYYTAMENRFGKCTSRQMVESWLYDTIFLVQNWKGDWLFIPPK